MPSLTSETEACLIIFKNSVRTAKKTPRLTVTKINRLTLFKEIIAVYDENHTHLHMQKADLVIVKVVVGPYRCYKAL
jgi:hypothetical protein